MKTNQSYLFNCQRKVICLPWLIFNDILNKYGYKFRFLFCKEDDDYVYGFGTNEKTIASLRYDTWKGIVADIKETLYRHNVEHFGSKRLTCYTTIASPWDVEDTRKNT